MPPQPPLINPDMRICGDSTGCYPEAATPPSAASASTLYRSLRQLSPEVLVAVKAAVAHVRADVWRRMPAIWQGEGILDFDASLVEIHSLQLCGVLAPFRRVEALR